MEWESNRVYCDVKFWCSLWITKPNGTTCFITLCGLFLLPLSDLLLLPLSFIFESEKLKNWELAKPRSIKTAHAFRVQQPNLDLESGIPSLTLISGVKWAWAVAGCFLLPSRFLVSCPSLSCAQERRYSLRFSASFLLSLLSFSFIFFLLSLYLPFFLTCLKELMNERIDNQRENVQ